MVGVVRLSAWNWTCAAWPCLVQVVLTTTTSNQSHHHQHNIEHSATTGLAMIGAVEDDEFDIQSGLMAGWAVTFCLLYIIVMVFSIVLYLLTVRAMALEIRSHNTTYLFVMVLFLAAVVEFGVIMGEFLARFGHFSYTELNCKLVVFARHGNRILQVGLTTSDDSDLTLVQVTTILTMLGYTSLAVYLKTTRFQLVTRRYFPVLALVLVTFSTLTVLQPTLNVRSNPTEQWCQYVHPDLQSRLVSGWLYTVILPYLLPLLLSVGPSVYLALRLRAGLIIEPLRSQVMVTLAVLTSYFIFYLLHFILMTARQVNFMTSPTSMHRLLGKTLLSRSDSHIPSQDSV